MAQFTPSRPAAIAGLLALAALAGCKKDKVTVVPPTPPVVAPAVAFPLVFSATDRNGAAVTSISGTLVSMRSDVNYLQAGSEFLQSTRIESAQARFHPSNTRPGAVMLEDGGAVSVNTVSLDKQADNAYVKAAGFGLTDSPLLMSTLTTWKVAGAGGVPAFTFAQAEPFPSYNGTPSQRVGTLTRRQVVLTNEVTETANNLIVRTEDLVLRLGSGVSGADSLYVIVRSGNDAPVMVRTTVQESTTSTGATVRAPTEVVIPASRLALLSPNTTGTAFLQTVAFRVVPVSQGGKTFVFVKAGVRSTPISIR